MTTTTYRPRKLQLSNKLVNNLMRLKYQDAHVFANKVWLGTKHRQCLTVAILESCKTAGLVYEYKDHWFRLTREGRKTIREWLDK